MSTAPHARDHGALQRQDVPPDPDARHHRHLLRSGDRGGVHGQLHRAGVGLFQHAVGHSVAVRRADGGACVAARRLGALHVRHGPRGGGGRAGQRRVPRRALLLRVHGVAEEARDAAGHRRPPAGADRGLAGARGERARAADLPGLELAVRDAAERRPCAPRGGG